MGLGKEYRKEQQALKGAALFYLALEQSGGKKLGGANEIIKAAFKDLGVLAVDVHQYIAENRSDLEEILSKRKRDLSR
jgi:hypothetical protein